MVPSEEIMEILEKAAFWWIFLPETMKILLPEAQLFWLHTERLPDRREEKDCRLGPGRFRRRKGKGNGQGSDPEGSK